MIEYCICKHPKNEHIMGKFTGTEFCFICAEDNIAVPKSHHNFQLDNLKYIEDLAKEKGLV